MKRLKRITLSCLLSVMAIINANAQWTDVTDAFIINPKFDTGNTNGWDYWCSWVQNHGFQGATYRNGDSWISGFIELWIPNPSRLREGEICQYAELPKGRYRLSVDAIATYQGNESERPQGVNLLAYQYDTDKKSMTSIETGNGKPQHFSINFEVIRDICEVKLGITVDDNTNCNWVAADNFRLEMRSEDIIPLNNIILTPSSCTLTPGDNVQIEVEYSPSNATLKACRFTSSDESVVKVDGNGIVTAYAEGKAKVIAYSSDGAVKAECNITVEKTAYVDGSLVINEIQASNVDYVLDPSFNYGSWIELYNTTDKACGLAGMYITDDPGNLKKFRLSYMIGSVPAHGYKNIWFDHYGIWNVGEMKQVDFKLDYNGGTIIISDGNTILLQQDYPQAIGRASYARTIDGGDTWGFSTTPTPEGSNADMEFANEQLAIPEVDTDGKVFSGTLKVRVAIPSGAILRYTTDGSTPTLDNGNTSTDGRFTVNESTAFRFRLFKEGYLPSEVVTRSYIQDDSGKPIIAMTIDDNNIYSEDYGLFVKGPNGRPGNGQDDKCNWNMDWDRPANFEFITENNVYAISQEVDISTCGGWSRANWPKSFKIKAAKYYQGNNSLDYQFFDGKPFLKHKVLQIRNGGSGNRHKDAALHEIMRRSGLNIETQSWKAVRVYFNGGYYGELNMREPNNKHYGYANYGIDTDEMDQFEMSPDSGYVQMTGTKDSFSHLIELSYNAANASTYEEIGNLLDIDQYINYMAAEFYLGNWDWPQNNVKGFRDQNDGKFHFVVYDLDGVFSADFYTFKGKKNYTFDSLRGEDVLGRWKWGDRFTQEIEFVTLFENMLKNEEFRRKFVDAICVIGGSTFNLDFALDIINEVSQQTGSYDGSVVNNLRNRQSSIASQLKKGAYDFGVNNSQTINASLSSSVDGANIYVNDMPVPTGKFKGILYQPITAKAIAPAGHKFRGWRLASGSLENNYETKTVFSKGTVWSYYDGTEDLKNEDWKSADYVSSWPQGNAPIGYDKDNNPKGLNTWVTHKVLPTYYVSKNFTLDSKADADRFLLDFRVDDGMVIYINGKEAARHNLPAGEINYNTYSNTWADNQYDFGTLELPNGLFRIGENTIAVEIHNNDNVSSDIHWDAALSHLVVQKPDDDQYVSTDAEYTLPNGSSINLIADYEPISEDDFTEENGVYPVRINEVSAGNSMYVNDYFKKDDWIELYNTTNKPIDVAGMYLSDNENKPKKFQIPDDDRLQTVIEPYSHLVVWASKRDIKGEQIHANFKLDNADGKMVLLTSADETWSDKIIYDTHRGDETVGRYPDGANDIYKMQRPTIGKTNELTSYAQYLYASIYTPPIDPEATSVTIPDESLTVNSIEYYSLNGIKMGNSRSNLGKGIYIMKYTRSNGTSVSKKIIIK